MGDDFVGLFAGGVDKILVVAFLAQLESLPEIAACLGGKTTPS